MYPIILKLHLALVALSLLLYLARAVSAFGSGKLAGHPLMLKGAGTSTLLILLSAVALCVMTAQYPFTDGWLTEKLVGLIAYVVLAIASLKAGLGTSVRALLMLAALGAFGATLIVAKLHAGFLF